MRIIFASFQGVNKKRVPDGMTRLVLPLLKYFPENDGYFVSYSCKINSNIKVLPHLHFLMRRAIEIISRVFGISNGFARLYQEILYDLFLHSKLKKPSIIFSTAYIPKTARKNRKLGGLNIFLAGNPYDRHINNILKSEESKFNIKLKDVYTYGKRLAFIDEFLYLQDHIITQSSVTQESFLNYFDESKLTLQEVHIIPNGSQFQSGYYEKENKLRFVYIAHTVWLKGLIHLIQAWNKINPNHAKLVIAGGMHPSVQNEMKKHGISNIEFIGPVKSDGLNKFFRQADICIVPSLVDDHPATISEALYCGLPVITTEGCGSKTLIKDGENGFVVPVSDADGLAKKIQWFIDNRDKIQVMSTKARESIVDVENSDQNKILAHHIVEVIEKLKREKGID